MLEEYTMEEKKQQKGRSPDSLIQTIDRIERLEKQLKIAVDILQYYADEDIYDRRVQITINGNIDWESEVMLDCGVKAKHYLKKIKELEK